MTLSNVNRAVCAAGAVLAAAFAAISLSMAAQAAPDEPFETWLADFRTRAQALGYDGPLVDNAFAGVKPDMSLIELDQNQAEFSRAVWDYLDSAVSDTRVSTGRALLAEEADLFARVSALQRVDAGIIASIWALESSFGQFIGDTDVVTALATLAWEGRRREFFENELIAVLDILASGAATREDLVGGWAGAMGQTQFMPTTYRRYAVDFDGDGRKDLWGNRGDALASAARYLRDHGWKRSEPWGIEVRLASGFNYALADGRRLPVGAWALRGVTRIDGQIWSESDQFRRARLLLPAGANGPAFLTYDNFDVILRYNNATSYALAAGLLMNKLTDGPSVSARWPRSEQPLSREQVKQLQTNLTTLGYTVGGVDGLVGPNTRKAIRAWQKARGQAADAFPTLSMLAQIEAEAARGG